MEALKRLSAFVDEEVRRARGRAWSLFDTRSWSETRGCGDREFWMYRTLFDRPRLAFQASALGLSLTATSAAERDIVRQAAFFWSRALRSDGSVDEWFENERSFCATAYVTLAMARLRDREPNAGKAVDRALAQSARWLSQKDNPLVSNQAAAAAAALILQPKFRDAGMTKLDALLARQDREGWFPEYGGADTGYSLLLLDSLATIWEATGEERCREAAGKLCRFLTTLVHPDGTLGGSYNSRGTSHFFPYGLRSFAESGDAAALALIEKVAPAFSGTRLPTPATVDDLYFAYFYFNSFALARRPEVSVATTPALEEAAGGGWRPSAHLLTRKEGPFTLTMNASRGGSFVLYRGNERVDADNGLLVETNGQKWTSGYVGTSALSAGQGEGGLVVVEGVLRKVKRPPTLAGRFLPFLLFVKSVLRIPGFSAWFTGWLKRKHILEGEESPIRFRRTFSFVGGALRIRDEVFPPSPMAFLTGGVPEHSPSSGFEPPIVSGSVATSETTASRERQYDAKTP